jgi:hypothetical protein
MLALFEICPLDRDGLRAALHMPVTDYEDAVQYVSALSAKVDVIVSRDQRGFAGLAIPVLSPSEMLARLSS